ncbi:hypothetical protein HKD37_16G045600 [Glycine soja]
MWDLIQVTCEGTPKVRRARNNSFIQEYETFRMKQVKIYCKCPKEFHSYSESTQRSWEKSLNRTWQPKVIKISESEDLTSITNAELFGKLRKYEVDITRIAKEEEKEKKMIKLALKTTTSLGDESEEQNVDGSDAEL